MGLIVKATPRARGQPGTVLRARPACTAGGGKLARERQVGQPAMGMNLHWDFLVDIYRWIKESTSNLGEDEVVPPTFERFPESNPEPYSLTSFGAQMGTNPSQGKIKPAAD